MLDLDLIFEPLMISLGSPLLIAGASRPGPLYLFLEPLPLSVSGLAVFANKWSATLLLLLVCSCSYSSSYSCGCGCGRQSSCCILYPCPIHHSLTIKTKTLSQRWHF